MQNIAKSAALLLLYAAHLDYHFPLANTPRDCRAAYSMRQPVPAHSAVTDAARSLETPSNHLTASGQGKAR